MKGNQDICKLVRREYGLLKSLCIGFPTGLYAWWQYICHVKWLVWVFIVPARCADGIRTHLPQFCWHIRCRIWACQEGTEDRKTTLAWLDQLWLSAGLNVRLPVDLVRKVRSDTCKSHQLQRAASGSEFSHLCSFEHLSLVLNLVELEENEEKGVNSWGFFP